MALARANDVDLYYELHGSGPPLALVMGLGGNVAMWDPELIDGLARHFRVIAIENRGTGRSDKPDHPYSIKMFADDAAVLLKRIGCPRAHVVGASMGGMIAQQLALDHPDCVDRLVLCCTAAGGSHMVAPTEETLAIIANVDGVDAVELTRRNRRLAFTEEFIARHEDYLEAKMVREVEYPTPPFALAHHFSAAVHFNVYDRLAEISHRTLVMTGREDRMIPAANSVTLAQRIPRADLIMYGGAGHGFMTERRDEVIREIIAFCRGALSPPSGGGLG